MIKAELNKQTNVKDLIGPTEECHYSGIHDYLSKFSREYGLYQMD